MSAPSFLVPCTLEAAYKWAVGEIGDSELVLSCPLIPQAVYFGNLPNRAAYRDSLQKLLYYWRHGARVVILRTATPEVIEHICNHGARRTCLETDTGKGRFIAGANFVDDYCRRLAKLPRIPRYGRSPQNAADCSGVTISR